MPPLSERTRWRVAGGAVLLLFLAALWAVPQVLLLGFAGALLALLFQTMAEALSQRTPLSYRWSLTLVLLVLAAVLGVGVWQLGAHVAEQVGLLAKDLPQALRAVEHRVQSLLNGEVGEWVEDVVRDPDEAMPQRAVWGRITGAAATTMHFFLGIFVVVMVGIFGAAEPRWYVDGTIGLMPHHWRPRALVVARSLGTTLRWWLIAKLVSMSIVGVLTWTGLTLVGMEPALLLALLAAAGEMIPALGPTLAAIPAVLLALMTGPTMAFKVVCVYLVIQTLESHVILPLVQRFVADLPPATTLLVVVAMGLLAGVLGAFLAAPLVAVGLVLVRALHVEDTLNDGESSSTSADAAERPPETAAASSALTAIGETRWTLPGGPLPSDSGRDPSHEGNRDGVWIVNPSGRTAHATLRTFFPDRAAGGPYECTIPAGRAEAVRLLDLRDPEPIPRDVEFVAVVESDVPILCRGTGAADVESPCAR